jgi:hypothetical protein
MINMTNKHENSNAATSNDYANKMQIKVTKSERMKQFNDRL